MGQKERETKTSSTFCNNWLAAFHIDVGPVTAIGCGEPGIDCLSIRGSGWFYSGYSGFHPFRKEKRDKKRKERKRERKERKRENIEKRLNQSNCKLKTLPKYI